MTTKKKSNKMIYTCVTFVHVKNFMQFSSKPNGILLIGINGPDLSGLSMPTHDKIYKPDNSFH